MPLLPRIISFTCILAYMLSGCTQSVASNKQSLIQDANAFCDIHQAKHWKDISSNTPITEFNDIAYARVHKVLNTNEFKKLLEEMKSVEFYRQMYSTAKTRIEEITGETWDCPAYMIFYSIKTSRESTVSHANEPNIVITKEGEYLVHNKRVKLTPNSLKVALDHDNNPRSKLIIKLDPGASDKLLNPLFQALIPLGIENVSVLSEE